MQGSDLKAIRQSLGLSQEDFATLLGMTQKFVGMMERGDAPIERRTALAARQLQNERSRLYTSHAVAELDDDVPLAHAQVIWERDDGGPIPPIKVVDMRGKPPKDDHRYSCSWGACNQDFNERDGVGQLLLLLAKFVELTAIEGIDADDVHAAFTVIPEYRSALHYGFFDRGVVRDV